MSSSESEEDITRSRKSMKSLFESSSRQANTGSQSLKYEGPPKKTTAGGNSFACQSSVVIYRDQTHVANGWALICVASNGVSSVVVVDKDRKPVARVKIDSAMQIYQNFESKQYVAMYDAAVQGHWTLMFKTGDDASGFVCGCFAIRYFVLQSQGERAGTHDDLSEADPIAPMVSEGDEVGIGMKVWVMQRVGAFHTVGKLVDDVADESPKLLNVGSGTVMVGAEEALIGMSKGQRRVVYVPAKKTRSKGLENPDIGRNDMCVVLLYVAEHTPKTQPHAARHVAAPAPVVVEREPEPPAPAPQPPAAPQPPQQPMMGGADSNSLLQTLQLLTTLQQPGGRAAPAASSGQGPDVERSLDRIIMQLSSLYEKIDRIDIERKLEANNEKLERMVKKAVGKMPVNDVDIEDMSKDRDQLLAKIEHVKKKLEDMTDSYHNALEQLGRHKEETGGLRADLAIERETNSANLKEITERKRLEMVDLEVRHRRDMEKAVDTAAAAAKEKGYAAGFEAGKLEATQYGGSVSEEELRHMLSKKDQEFIKAQQEFQQLQSQMYEDKRAFDDQISSMKHLLGRLESRSNRKAKDIIDHASVIGRTMKRSINTIYNSIEEQVFAMGAEMVPASDVVDIIRAVIKTEGKAAVETVKRDLTVAVAEADQQVFEDGASHQHTTATDGDEAAVGSVLPYAEADSHVSHTEDTDPRPDTEEGVPEVSESEPRAAAVDDASEPTMSLAEMAALSGELAARMSGGIAADPPDEPQDAPTPTASDGGGSWGAPRRPPPPFVPKPQPNGEASKAWTPPPPPPGVASRSPVPEEDVAPTPVPASPIVEEAVEPDDASVAREPTPVVAEEEPEPPDEKPASAAPARALPKAFMPKAPRKTMYFSDSEESS